MRIKRLTVFLFMLSEFGFADNYPIIVEEKELVTPAQSVYSTDVKSQNYVDGGDFLRNLPGVTGSRFGGHGIDPVIRGQSQEQLNVTLDDAFIYGGCPNRMDPPSAYANINSFDEVIVTKGYQTVLNGPGAPGGSVNFKKGTPRFDGKPYLGSISSLYDSNTNQNSSSANISFGNSKYYSTINGTHKYANNYDDGDGVEVRSAFEENSYGATVGLTPNSTDDYRFSFQRHEVLDALFPGAGMDSPYSKTTNLTLKGKHNWGAKIIKSSSFTLFLTQVDHQMDNFSLRPQGSSIRKVDSTSDTYGARIENKLKLFGIDFGNTFEFRKNERDASRFQGTTTSTVDTLQSSMWPGIDIEQFGIALEGTKPVGNLKIIAGVRADFISVDYNRADQVSSLTNRSANDLYRQFYGYGSQGEDETNLGGLIRLENQLTTSSKLKIGLSRSIRTADSTERGLANDMVMMGNNLSWVGNPQIKPEKHHQLDIGLAFSEQKLQAGFSVYYNQVNDYILRDSARGQLGILVNSPSADIYSNIEAYLAGAEFETLYQALPELNIGFNFFYTYGKNKTYDIPLAQIPAFQGNLFTNYVLKDRLTITPELVWAFKQNRIDSNTSLGSGRDIRATPGYTVWNLKIAYDFKKTLQLSAAATNIFDKKYANHLNRSNISNSQEVQVFEPGRSFSAGVTFRF